MCENRDNETVLMTVEPDIPTPQPSIDKEGEPTYDDSLQRTTGFITSYGDDDDNDDDDNDDGDGVDGEQQAHSPRYGDGPTDSTYDSDDQQQTGRHITAVDEEDEMVQTPSLPVAAPTVSTRTKRGKQKITNLFQDDSVCDEKSGSSNTAGKRKGVINVSMLDFVHLVLRIAVDTTVRQCSVDETIIGPYLEELRTGGIGSVTKPVTHKLDTSAVGVKPAKRMKMHLPFASAPIFLPTDSTATVSLAEAKFNEAFEKYSSKSKRTIYFGVVTALFVALERVNANLHFSREHLKYFLATHQRNVTVSDFADTNQLRNGSGVGASRKQKSPARLNNGAILVEYAKAPSTFASNLTRCEPSDVEAVRFIVEMGVSLSPAIYRNLTWRLDDVSYVVDKEEHQRPDHVRIPISNFKRGAILINESVVLVYDGTQFILPPPNVERDFTATMIASARLKRKEHIVLDTLMAAKLRVIDIIMTNKEDFVIPTDYSDRLRLVAETFEGVKTVSLDECLKQDDSYIEKSRFDVTAPVYIYYKPNHTLAAFGVQEHNVYLAYQDDAGDLIFKTTAVNAGPASLALGVIALQPLRTTDESATVTDKIDESTPPTILLLDNEGNGRRVKILGLENEPDVRLFTRAVCVELKDGNKLGALSFNAVTNVREYKSPTAAKEAPTNISINNLTTFFDDLKNFETIMKALNRSTQYDRFVRTLKSETMNLTTLDLGYS